MPRTILVTGANGFVGKALCARLQRDYSVRAAMRTNVTTPDFLYRVNMGSLDAHTDWRAALSGVDTVVHLAARVHVMREVAIDPLLAFRETNVAATLQLARQAVDARVKRLVFMSSVKANGELTLPGQPFRESDVPKPQDAYGQSKCEAEEGLRQIATSTGLEVVIIRPPLVYGPGVKANFASLMRVIARAWPLPLGAIDNKRSLVGLGNLVDFISLCASHPHAANQTFFVSDGQDLSTTDLLRAMAHAAQMPARLLPVPPGLLIALAGCLGQKATMQRLCGNLQVDIAKAQTLLQWVPPFTVNEGLQHAYRKALFP